MLEVCSGVFYLYFSLFHPPFHLLRFDFVFLVAYDDFKSLYLDKIIICILSNRISLISILNNSVSMT